MPLSRYRVIDLTTVRSGPTCTKILADLGGDVLRVERPGDSGRDRVFFDQGDLQRNKKSLVLNLQHPKGVEILRALAWRADVVVENYRPDVKHRLAIDYETLSRENPRLVYASISGFGQTGPYRDRPGYDQIVQGMSGLMSLTGTAETAPLRIGIPIGDLLAGYFAALGILAAVFADPQVVQSRLVHELSHPLWGLHEVIGLPVRLHRTPAEVKTPAPLPGAHTREVLVELGYDGDAIETLLADGVVEEAKGA
ncbi:MAG: CoA transferase [Candidatus Rokubacteria bacterium]|nr:CoA transferase [Candidatus Rokubacteria bacterium]